MKKALLITVSALFISSLFTACKSNAPHCQAYSKVEKVKADKTEKPL
jgi:hypothetical protein